MVVEKVDPLERAQSDANKMGDGFWPPDFVRDLSVRAIRTLRCQALQGASVRQHA